MCLESSVQRIQISMKQYTSEKNFTAHALLVRVNPEPAFPERDWEATRRPLTSGPASALLGEVDCRAKLSATIFHQTAEQTTQVKP